MAEKHRYSKKNIFLSVASVISIVSFLIIWLNLNSFFAQNFEHQTSEFIQSFRNVGLTSFMKLITEIGNVWGNIVIISVLGIILIVKKRFDIIIQIVSIVLSSALINILLKSLINRPRPFGQAIVKVNFHSFPSGHAMSAMIFYGLMIYFIVMLIRSLTLKSILILISVIMILLIGISRIYLGVHYPTDVIAGYLAGLASLCISIMVMNYFRLNNA